MPEDIGAIPQTMEIGGKPGIGIITENMVTNGCAADGEAEANEEDNFKLVKYKKDDPQSSFCFYRYNIASLRHYSLRSRQTFSDNSDNPY